IFFDLKIGLNWAEALADQIGLVGLEPVQRQLVFFGKDGNGLEAELICRTEDTNGDLAAIGDEDFLDWHRLQFRAGGVKDRSSGPAQHRYRRPERLRVQPSLYQICQSRPR